ncbi:MAG TPA: 4Fe-4S dicluster domain-containing protein [Phycisphaerae bacterium]|jgi:Fe-S-cluster-containing dehydrogenase component/formate-dependent nitrite reductase membrane component NrfD
MPRFGFAIDNRACIGCHACTVACKSEHLVPLGVNRTWVKYIEKGVFPNTRRHFSVQRCNHCADAPCVTICPVTSLYQRPDGIVDFDSSRCIGCKACMQACPYDALYLDPDTNTAAKCNYCTHRVDSGYEPACVIVCPVEAIVSGDLDDPTSRIAQLDRLQKVQYPKVEKGTRPKLFYVGGETAALDPAAAPPAAHYLWSGNDGRITDGALRRASEESDGEARARRVYDPQSKPAPWGWMVSAYITTKAVATGVVLVAVAAFAVGWSPAVLPTSLAGLSLLVLAMTGALLVGDLKQPRRFLYVLLRPQWKSWLVRGAYLILVFSLLVPVCWFLSVLGAPRGVQLAVGALTGAAAVCVAAYTALLLAQAKGRDYWQNPLLVVTMVVDAGVAGLALMTILNLAHSRAGLVTGAIVIGLLLAAEFLPVHQTRNAELASRLITRGALRVWFWFGVVGLGLAGPLLASAFGALRVTGAMLLLGIAAKNHVLVQAPQRVPLS